MAKVIKLEWNTVRQHRVYLEVPDEFETNDYDMDQILGSEVDEDECETGELFEREEIQAYDVPAGSPVRGLVIPGLHELRLS